MPISPYAIIVHGGADRISDGLINQRLDGCQAGLIVIDRAGRIAHAHNTPHMPVCYIDGYGKARTAS